MHSTEMAGVQQGKAASTGAAPLINGRKWIACNIKGLAKIVFKWLPTTAPGPHDPKWPRVGVGEGYIYVVQVRAAP